MAELAYREPQYLQILDLPHTAVSQTRAQSARLSLFIQTLNDYRISPRPHIRLYRPRRNSLRPYHTSNRHEKPPPPQKKTSRISPSHRVLVWAASPRVCRIYAYPNVAAELSMYCRNRRIGPLGPPPYRSIVTPPIIYTT